jgi:hypothetical protein
LSLLQNLLVPVDEYYADTMRVDVRLVGGDDVVDPLVQLGDRLDPGAPAAYDDEV